MTRIELLRVYVSKKECGTRGKYVSGCRCTPCKAANSRYQCERERKAKDGLTNELVDAEPARVHLKKLSKAGIGYKTVADYSGLGKSTLLKILQRERTRIRKENLMRILAVDTKCVSDGTIVSAGETWQRIKWMRDEGFTDAEIARRMGCKMPHLQIGRKRITGRTAAKVERIYRIVRLGE